MRVKDWIRGLTILFVVLNPISSAHAGNRRIVLNHQDKPGVAQTLPLEIYRNFLVVTQGQIGGSQDRQNFIVDTGTAPSIINARVADQLGLQTTASVFKAAGRVVPTQTAIIPEIDLGPISAVSLSVQVQDLSRWEHDLGIPIAGIIGLDVLSQASFDLNYDKKVIVFGGVTRDGIAIRIDEGAGIAVAKVEIAGKLLRLLVDTGSDHLVLFGGNFGEAHRLELRDISQTGTSLTETGMRVQTFAAPDIAVGGQHFSKDKGYFIPGSADPAFDGLLGVRALGFRELSYDKSLNTIFLRR